MLTLLFSLRDCFRSRAVRQAEILALRHQLLIFERSRRGHNLRLRWTDRALWVWLSLPKMLSGANALKISNLQLNPGRPGDRMQCYMASSRRINNSPATG